MKPLYLKILFSFKKKMFFAYDKHYIATYAFHNGIENMKYIV